MAEARGLQTGSQFEQDLSLARNLQIPSALGILVAPFAQWARGGSAGLDVPFIRDTKVSDCTPGSLEETDNEIPEPW